jgi:hypothetical protein
VKYLLLVYGEEALMATVRDADCKAYSESLDQDLVLAADALERIETATTVRVRDGRAAITDGPFAETKEQLAGFYLIDARDLDQAIEVASGLPPAQIGSIEIRPVRELRP